MPAVSTALALLAAAGFALLALPPWLAPEPPPAPAAPPAATVEEPGAGLGDEPPPTDLSPFRNRPLFSVARRPPPPEAPGVKLEDPNAHLLFGRWEIAGVVEGRGGAVALLRDADGRLLRLRAGDRIPTAEGDEAEALSVALEALTFRRRGATVAAPVRREGAGDE